MESRTVIGMVLLCLFLNGKVTQAQGSDLYITSGAPTAWPNVVPAGGTPTLTAWEVKNLGTVSTGVGFSNGFYISEAKIGALLRYLDGNTNDALAPGQSFKWGGPTLTIPADQAPGEYALYIIVDIQFVVAETDEGNNSVSTLIRVTPATDVGLVGGKTPDRFVLHQNYPNPFNPSTTITYELPKSSEVRLSVYDMLGREVAVLANEQKDAGQHEVRFDGSGLSSGVYLYRLQAGGFVQGRRLLLIK